MLFVDDNPMFGLIRYLRNHEDLYIQVETEPRIAYRKIRSGLEYDILVTDMRFENYQGGPDATLEELQLKYDGILLVKTSREINPEKPVIITSAWGYGRLLESIECFKEGVEAIDIITIAENPENLVNLIKKMMVGK